MLLYDWPLLTSQKQVMKEFQFHLLERYLNTGRNATLLLKFYQNHDCPDVVKSVYYTRNKAKSIEKTLSARWTQKTEYQQFYDNSTFFFQRNCSEPISGTTVLKWNLDSKCLNNLSFLLHDYFSFYAQVVKVDLDGLVTVLWSDESTSSILPSRLYVLDKEAS